MKNANQMVLVIVKSNFIPTGLDLLDAIRNPVENECSNVERYRETSIIVEHQEIDGITDKNIVVFGKRIEKSKLGILNTEDPCSVSMMDIISNKPQNYAKSQDSVNRMINLVSLEVEKKFNQERDVLLEALVDMHDIIKQRTTRVKVINSELLLAK